MEFLRFGSSIPGSYWGCCAVCIIQNFKKDPAEKASIQLVSGDGGQPLMQAGGKAKFAGKTHEEIFVQRLRYGTFNGNDMPNHAFFAVLTESQISGGHGKAWMKILKREGFEFVRTTDNSVYTGQGVASDVGKSNRSPHRNYIFGLFRNVGDGSVEDTLTPPKAWTDLDSVVPEPWQMFKRGSVKKFMKESFDKQKELYSKLPKGVFYTQEQLEADGVPVTFAGKRSLFPQQPKAQREAAEAHQAKSKSAPASAPFQKAATVPPPPVETDSLLAI